MREPVALNWHSSDQFKVGITPRLLDAEEPLRCAGLTRTGRIVVEEEGGECRVGLLGKE
jgi:hypothetical protein